MLWSREKIFWPFSQFVDYAARSIVTVLTELSTHWREYAVSQSVCVRVSACARARAVSRRWDPEQLHCIYSIYRQLVALYIQYIQTASCTVYTVYTDCYLHCIYSIYRQLVALYIQTASCAVYTVYTDS